MMLFVLARLLWKLIEVGLKEDLEVPGGMPEHVLFMRAGCHASEPLQRSGLRLSQSFGSLRWLVQGSGRMSVVCFSGVHLEH